MSNKPSNSQERSKIPAPTFTIVGMQLRLGASPPSVPPSQKQKKCNSEHHAREASHKNIPPDPSVTETSSEFKPEAPRSMVSNLERAKPAFPERSPKSRPPCQITSQHQRICFGLPLRSPNLQSSQRARNVRHHRCEQTEKPELQTTVFSATPQRLNGVASPYGPQQESCSNVLRTVVNLQNQACRKARRSFDAHQ